MGLYLADKPQQRNAQHCVDALNIYPKFKYN